MTAGYEALNGLPQPTKQKIYVQRHARTVLDSIHRSDGWINLPLSDEGRQQLVVSLSDYLQHVPITCIYAAPLKRTIETADVLSSGMSSHPDVEIAIGAMPWNLGSLAGSPKEPNKRIVRDLLANPERKAPDGESYEEFLDRFDPWLKRQQDDSEDEGPFLLILSGSNCRRISEMIFNDRHVLDIDESGIFVMYPEGDRWTAEVLSGQRDEADVEKNPEVS